MLEIAVLGSSQKEREIFKNYGRRYGVDFQFYDSVEELCAGGGQNCVSISHSDFLDEESLRSLKQAGIEYISTRSIGVNHIDVDMAKELEITVENVAYSPGSVAEHTLMLMLMSLRNMKNTEKNVENYDYRLPEERFRELREMTVGVVGTGRIGQAVIRLLKGFGCKILCYDEWKVNGLEYVSYEELLQNSDIVTYHIPLTKESRHMLNQNNMQYLKSGAYVINTARGALIDNVALIQALEEGRLSGAALDVIENEEGCFYQECEEVEENLARLCRMENVIVTPHSAFYTQRALDDSVKNSIVGCIEHSIQKAEKEKKAYA